ncbi:MAG TPA: putative zinc-binding metallopeptidase [Vicinamibacteria bacterium]|nr:putative zinc-binding metallopeptidase [Vicinamibacteria bacterium]
MMEDPQNNPAWADLSEEQLLDLRLCDLGLQLDGGFLGKRIEELEQELAEKGLLFRPYFWLGEEWFTPSGVPGVALPFYLAHPRLMKLERSQMLEVEGGTEDWCRRILRHECGHAIDHAYRLHRRRNRQKLFGLSSAPYPEDYAPKPFSKNFVRNIDYWYAQSHPDEDFAETFAVWLDTTSSWRVRYQGWAAFKKLKYMDELMREIANQTPSVKTRQRPYSISSLKRTLRAHYAKKREQYQVDLPKLYDRDLKRLFDGGPEAGGIRAAAFIASHRKEARRLVARWTGVYQYTVDQVIAEMIARSRHLGLFLRGDPDEAKLNFSLLLAVHTMNYLHSGRYRLAL